MVDAGALTTLFAVARALRVAGAPFLVGGSLASSFQGIPRSTRDVDLVADLKTTQVDSFVEGLGGHFYVDAERIRIGIRNNSSFNVIDLRNGFKADVYLLGTDAFSRSQLTRASTIEIEPGEALPLASPEDVVLHKLRWYRMGGDVSDRQWLDVLGVLKVQGTRLDRDYLYRWAESLGVGGLLSRAFLEAGIP